MANVTINGTELNTDEPKLVQRALAKARREEAKAEKVRSDAYASALAKAARNGFKILSRKASGDAFPTAWRVYRSGDKWSRKMATSPLGRLA